MTKRWNFETTKAPQDTITTPHMGTYQNVLRLQQLNVVVREGDGGTVSTFADVDADVSVFKELKDTFHHAALADTEFDGIVLRLRLQEGEWRQISGGMR